MGKEKGLDILVVHGMNGSGKDTHATMAKYKVVRPVVRDNAASFLRQQHVERHARHIPKHLTRPHIPIPYAEVISTGDMCRGAIKNEGKYAQYSSIIEQYAQQTNGGALVPDEAIMAMVTKEIETVRNSGKNHIIFTGFPRTEPQLEAFNNVVAKQNGEIGRVRHVLLDVDAEDARARSASRREKDIADGRAPRKDDDPGIVNSRIDVFTKSTQPMIDTLRKRKEITIIDARKSKETVHDNFVKSLGLRKKDKNYGKKTE